MTGGEKKNDSSALHNQNTAARKRKKKVLRGISIGFQLMCLITFAFYCVKEEMMKMVDENGGDTQV